MDYITFIDFYKSLSLKEKRIIQNIQKCIDDHDAKINIQDLFSKDDDWISLTEKYEIINALLSAVNNKSNWLLWLLITIITIIIVVVIVIIVHKFM